MSDPRRPPIARQPSPGDCGALFLDSADLADLSVARDLGVRALTTNPALFARHSREPLVHLERLLEAFDGLIAYQPSAGDIGVAEREVRAAAALGGGRVVAKLPATLTHASLGRRLRADGIDCALTAVYTPGQALLAHQLGCCWIIPYVDRARRLLAEGDSLVGGLAGVLGQVGSRTRIVAASIKSGEQAVAAIAAGAAAVSCPTPVLAELAGHPLTDEAVADFARAAARAEISAAAPAVSVAGAGR